MAKMTHKGSVKSAYGANKVLLRETKLYWVTKGGTKYRKADGSEVNGCIWTCPRLDLESIYALEVE